MSRFEARFILRHPLRWIRICWWHWCVAALFAIKAAIVTNDIWQVTPADQYWPILLGAAAATAAASAIAPRDSRLQVFTAVVLLGVSVGRAATYLAVWMSSSSGLVERVLSQAFIVHWLMIAFVALRWEVLSTIAAGHIAVESGRDDRGGH